MSARAEISTTVKRLGSQPRWLLVPVLAALVIIVHVVPAAAAGGWPFAVGGGWNTDGMDMDKFAFSATNGPKARGENPSGYGRFDLSPEGTTVQGHVTCFVINTMAMPTPIATFTIQIDKYSGNPPSDKSLVVSVQDNGNPGSAGPDMMGRNFTSSPTDCKEQTLDRVVIQGNIVVDDGS